MIKVREVEALPGYRLKLAFSDGTSGLADFAKLVRIAPYKKLADAAEFGGAFIDHGHVEWPSGVGVATEMLYAMAHQLPKPKTLEDARANELEVSLRELRKLAGVTQVEASDKLGMDQGAISRFERQEDMRVSTLRRYIEALGGELEVTAVLGNKRMRLRGV